MPASAAAGVGGGESAPPQERGCLPPLPASLLTSRWRSPPPHPSFPHILRRGRPTAGRSHGGGRPLCLRECGYAMAQRSARPMAQNSRLARELSERAGVAGRGQDRAFLTHQSQWSCWPCLSPELLLPRSPGGPPQQMFWNGGPLCHIWVEGRSWDRCLMLARGQRAQRPVPTLLRSLHAAFGDPAEPGSSRHFLPACLTLSGVQGLVSSQASEGPGPCFLGSKSKPQPERRDLVPSLMTRALRGLSCAAAGWCRLGLGLNGNSVGRSRGPLLALLSRPR